MLVMTETVQDYLKAIWMLDRSGSGNVTTSALAERLGVTAASATAMIKRLASVGLVRTSRTTGSRSARPGRRPRSRSSATTACSSST